MIGRLLLKSTVIRTDDGHVAGNSSEVGGYMALSVSLMPRFFLSHDFIHTFAQVRRAKFQLDNAGGHGKDQAVKKFNK